MIDSDKTTIAFSSVSVFQIYLPSGENQNLFVEIRDHLNCVIQYNLSSISVQTDSQLIINNQILNLLSSQNQNIVSQLLISLSQQMN